MSSAGFIMSCVLVTCWPLGLAWLGLGMWEMFSTNFTNVFHKFGSFWKGGRRTLVRMYYAVISTLKE